jgi:hypothetical protein
VGSFVTLADQRGWGLAISPVRDSGGMAEWTNARLLKSRGTLVPVGSNPTPSAVVKKYNFVVASTRVSARLVRSE